MRVFSTLSDACITHERRFPSLIAKVMRRNLFLIFRFIITAITVTDVAWGQTWTQIEPAVEIIK